MLRAAFGLVSLLICTFIVVYLWASYNKPVAKASKQARIDASRIAGRADDGRPAADTATFKGVESPGGQLKAVRITGVDPTGPMAMHFGLAVGDEIVKVGPFDVGTTPLDDVDSVKNYVGADAYRSNMDLVVNRGGQTITLPAQRNTPIPGATPPPAAGVPGIAAAPGNTPATQPAAIAQQKQQSQPAAAPPPPQGKNGYGAAMDLRDQIERAQHHGD